MGCPRIVEYSHNYKAFWALFTLLIGNFTIVLSLAEQTVNQSRQPVRMGLLSSLT